MSKWYYSKDGEAKGPVDEEHIKSEIRAGRLSLIDLVFLKGDNKWRPISEFPELAQLTKTFSKNLRELEKEQAPKEWVVLKKKIDVGESKYNQEGPYSSNDVIELLKTGEIKYSDFIWKTGFKRWARIGHLPEFDRRTEARDQVPSEIPTPGENADPVIEEPQVDENFKEDLMQVERPNFFEDEAPPQDARGPDLTQDDLNQDQKLSIESDEPENEAPLSQTQTRTKSQFTKTTNQNEELVDDLFQKGLGGAEEESGLAEETVITTDDNLISDELTQTLSGEIDDPLQQGPKISNIVDERVEDPVPEPPTAERMARAEAQTTYQANPMDLREVQSPFEQKDSESEPESQGESEVAEKYSNKEDSPPTDTYTSDFAKPATKSFTAIVDEELAALDEEVRESEDKEDDKSDDEPFDGDIGGGDVDQFDVDLSSPSISDDDSKKESKNKADMASVGAAEESLAGDLDEITPEPTAQPEDLANLKSSIDDESAPSIPETVPLPDELTSNISDEELSGVDLQSADEFSASGATVLDTSPGSESQTDPREEATRAVAEGSEAENTPPPTPSGEGLVKTSDRAARLQEEYNDSQDSLMNDHKELMDDDDVSEFNDFDETEDSTGLFSKEGSSTSDDEELSNFESFDEAAANRSEPIENQEVSKIISMEELEEEVPDLPPKPKEKSRYSKKQLDRVFMLLGVSLLVFLVVGFAYIFYPKWKKHINLDKITEEIGGVEEIIVDGSDGDEEVVYDTDFDSDNPQDRNQEIQDDSRQDPVVETEGTVVKQPVVEVKPTPQIDRPRPTPERVKPTRLVAKSLSIRTRNMASINNANIGLDVSATRGMPITIEILGESGRILDAASYFRTLSYKHDPGKKIDLNLKELRLTRGDYKVTARIGSIERRANFFYGVKNSTFRKELRAHLKQISYTQQRERKALFYTSSRLEKLSKDLVKKSRSLRKSPSRWSKYYRSWEVKKRQAYSGQIREIKKTADRNKAYPNLIRQLDAAYKKLGVEASALNSSIRNRRAMASPGGIKLAREFGEIRLRAQNLSNYR